MPTFEREVAWRVFADELSVSSHSFSGEGERAPTYLLTPLGAKVNRILFVGVIIDAEKVGDEESMWRARVSDPTGVVRIYAGQYQPESVSVLSELQPPTFVALIGKCRVYSPEEGTFYVSIRPEQIREVNSYVRDCWVLDTCAQTLRRIEAMKELQTMKEPNLDKLVALGYERTTAESLLKAREIYGDADIGRYIKMVYDALNFIAPQEGEERTMRTPSAANNTPQKPATTTKADERAHEHEAKILEFIGALDAGKGAAWKDIIEKASEIKIDEGAVEETINALMDKGLIYEPILGRLKKT